MGRRGQGSRDREAFEASLKVWEEVKAFREREKAYREQREEGARLLKIESDRTFWRQQETYQRQLEIYQQNPLNSPPPSPTPQLVYYELSYPPPYTSRNSRIVPTQPWQHR